MKFNVRALILDPIKGTVGDQDVFVVDLWYSKSMVQSYTRDHDLSETIPPIKKCSKECS